MTRFLTIFLLAIAIRVTAAESTVTIHTASDSRSRDVTAVLGSSLMHSGLWAYPLPEKEIPKEALRIGAWWNEDHTVSVIAIAKSEEVLVRIVPIQGADDKGGKIVDLVCKIVATEFPDLPIQKEKQEANQRPERNAGATPVSPSMPPAGVAHP